MPLASSNRFSIDGLDKLRSNDYAHAQNAASSAYENIAQHGLLGAVYVLLAPILTRSTPLIFGAAIEKKVLEKFWIWLERDGAPDIVGQLKKAAAKNPAKIEEIVISGFASLVAPLEKHLADAAANEETNRRLNIQVGGHEVFKNFPLLLTSFKHFNKLQTAKELARHARYYETVEQYAQLVEAIDLPAEPIRKLWCTFFVHELAWPGQFLQGVMTRCHGDNETAVRKAGYGAYVDALVVNAQRSVEIIEEQAGLFRDVDLMCRTIDRFHRIARALHYYLDLGKSSQWNNCLEILTAKVSKIIEVRLSEVVQNVTRVLRSSSADPKALFTTDHVLQAYNSVYLLDAARNAKESLAVNTIVDKSWAELGKALEVLVDRVLSDLKVAKIGDGLVIAKVDIAIKLSAIRFGSEYAEIIATNKMNIVRRKLKAPEA